jgi:hypothetical protein
MQIDKAQIVEFLKERGQHFEADKAQHALPDKVDTDQHGGLVAQHGISIQDLLGQFGDGNLGKLL